MPRGRDDNALLGCSASHTSPHPPHLLCPQANARKGGLLCLAATAVGLSGCGPEVERPPGLLQKITAPILSSFTDQDPRVRYYATEALFNVVSGPGLVAAGCLPGLTA